MVSLNLNEQIKNRFLSHPQHMKLRRNMKFLRIPDLEMLLRLTLVVKRDYKQLPWPFSKLEALESAFAILRRC